MCETETEANGIMKWNEVKAELIVYGLYVPNHKWRWQAKYKMQKQSSATIRKKNWSRCLTFGVCIAIAKRKTCIPRSRGNGKHKLWNHLRTTYD